MDVNVCIFGRHLHFNLLPFFNVEALCFSVQSPFEKLYCLYWMSLKDSDIKPMHYLITQINFHKTENKVSCAEKKH